MEAFQAALEFARREGSGQVRRDEEARELWRHVYEQELSIERHGLAGVACSRAEAHTLRLSMLYALLDRSDVVGRVHLEAALAVWRYCEHSALLVFGDRLGDPIADAIDDALARRGGRPHPRPDPRPVLAPPQRRRARRGARSAARPRPDHRGEGGDGRTSLRSTTAPGSGDEEQRCLTRHLVHDRAARRGVGRLRPPLPRRDRGGPPRGCLHGRVAHPRFRRARLGAGACCPPPGASRPSRPLAPVSLGRCGTGG